MLITFHIKHDGLQKLHPKHPRAFDNSWASTYDTCNKFCDIGLALSHLCVKGESGKVEVAPKEYTSLKE